MTNFNFLLSIQIFFFLKGKNAGRYERAKLKALLRHHRELGDSMEQHRQTDTAVKFLGIAKDQLEIMQGALDLRTITCGDAWYNFIICFTVVIVYLRVFLSSLLSTFLIVCR